MRIKPKKRLGQNFLIDKNIQRKIIDSLELKPADTVFEIGAGRGELTCLISQKVHRVFALEVDPGLCQALKDNLSAFSNATIINQDVLKFNFKAHLNKIEGKIKVIGNIPYYISTPIIERLIKSRDKIDTAFITVQKEFAARMSALPGSKEYGAFSCFVQYYAEPKILFTIKRTSFFPAPKVDSCLVRLNIRKEPAVFSRNEKLLFKIIRGAFNKRRKTLRNSLSSIIPPKKLESFFDKYKIDRNTRPERLSLQDFANLANT
jgi:16S rRNA (adenine1518-N6/adenine1519-N6)-dimethyltransferase